MNEKRFTDTNDGIYDNQEKRLYKISAYEFFDCETDEVVDLLNEQQTEITELREAIDYLKTVIRYTIPNQMVADVFKQIGEEYE